MVGWPQTGDCLVRITYVVLELLSCQARWVGFASEPVGHLLLLGPRMSGLSLWGSELLIYTLSLDDLLHSGDFLCC